MRVYVGVWESGAQFYVLETGFDGDTFLSVLSSGVSEPVKGCTDPVSLGTEGNRVEVTTRPYHSDHYQF